MQTAREILWTAAFLNERFTEPVSPLGWSHVGALFQELALRDPLRYVGYPDAEKIPTTRLWRALPYVNVEIFQILYKPFPDALAPADAARYFPDGDLNFRKRAPYPTWRLLPHFLWSLLRHMLRDALNTSPLNYRKWQTFVPWYETQIQRLGARLDAAADPPELARISAALYDLDTQLLSIHRWSLTYADVLHKLLARWAGDLTPQLISDTPNKTRVVNAQLAALARMPAPLNAPLLARIQRGGALSDAEQETARALDAFLIAHGHRAFSLDLAQPTFRDDPAQLLPLLGDAAASARSPRENLSAPFQTAWRKLRWWQRLLGRPVIGLARRYTQLREDQRYYWQKSLALTRRAYLKIGAQYTAQNILAAPAEIFYATRQELAQCARGEVDASFLRARIAARQNEWAAYRREFAARGAAATPHFLRGDTPLAEDKMTPVATNVWRGRGVSPGIARGVARIVHDPRALGRVGAGEILVTPSTDPAWTPVFARLGGLIIERGGILSHGAVVAREYQLPAVIVAGISRVLRDGQEIEVDGTNGSVRCV